MSLQFDAVAESTRCQFYSNTSTVFGVKFHKYYHVNRSLAFLDIIKVAGKKKIKISMLQSEPLAGGGSADNFLGLCSLKTYNT